MRGRDEDEAPLGDILPRGMVGWASSWAVLVMTWAERWAAARPLAGLRRPGKSFFYFQFLFLVLNSVLNSFLNYFLFCRSCSFSFIQELFQGTAESLVAY
jgi:hypothetical protein